MLAFLARRRLVLRLRHRQINASSGGTVPLQYQYNPSAIPLRGFAAGPKSEPCPTTVSCLVSCGLSPAAAAAAAAANKVRIRSTSQADAVCALLRRYSFSDADIARVTRSVPALLTFDPDRTIRPKLDFFVSLGLEPRKLASSPTVLAYSLDKHLVPCIQFLRSVIGADKDLFRAISRVPRALNVHVEKRMRPAVEALRRHGLTQEDISKLLVIQLGVLLMSPARIGEIFQELKMLDLRITDTRFLYCFKAICCIKRETWLQKLALYQSFGVSHNAVLEAFKTQPTILALAGETINKKLRFYLDELKLEPSDVMEKPVIIAYSLEKTVMPRCAVLNVLMREGKIGRDIKLLPALLGSCRNFSARYVFRYGKDVPDVLKAFEGKIKFEGFPGLRV